MIHYNMFAWQKTGSAHCTCQDRYRALRLEDRLILVVADGHGGRPYTRSALGADFGCSAAVAALREEVEGGDIPAAIKDRYDAMVAEHLACHPLEDDELERVGDLPHPVVYGTTLLAAVLTLDSTELYQLGDGEIHILKADGTFFPALPDDDGCRGNMTTSLANNREFALSHFRHARYQEPTAALMMFSDGCDGGLLRAAAGLAEPPALLAHLENMLHRTNHGDDQTFLLTYDPGIVEKDSFREGLSAALQTMRAEAKRRKREQRDWEEYKRLCSYLNLALRKANRMARRNDPELEAYMKALKPSYKRYMQLRARFGAENDS